MICPISGESITTVCELTTCGHVFDLKSIFQQMLHGTSTCALCRTPFTGNNVYCSPTLQKMVVDISNASTQTETTHEVGTDTTQQHAATSSNDHADHIPNYPPFRIVLVNDENYYNRQSLTSIDFTVLRDYNLRFAGEQKLYKYVYQTYESDVERVALELSRTGYFVYDIFPVNNDIFRKYLFYSSVYMADGSANRLSAQRRIGFLSHRLNL